MPLYHPFKIKVEADLMSPQKRKPSTMDLYEMQHFDKMFWIYLVRLNVFGIHFGSKSWSIFRMLNRDNVHSTFFSSIKSNEIECVAENVKNYITAHVVKKEREKIENLWTLGPNEKEEGIIRRMIGIPVRFHFWYDVATNPGNEMGGRCRRGSVTNVS